MGVGVSVCGVVYKRTLLFSVSEWVHVCGCVYVSVVCVCVSVCVCEFSCEFGKQGHNEQNRLLFNNRKVPL